MHEAVSNILLDKLGLDVTVRGDEDVAIVYSKKRTELAKSEKAVKKAGFSIRKTRGELTVTAGLRVAEGSRSPRQRLQDLNDKLRALHKEKAGPTRDKKIEALNVRIDKLDEEIQEKGAAWASKVAVVTAMDNSKYPKSGSKEHQGVSFTKAAAERRGRRRCNRL